ncbi:MAG: FG-GAP-like repeat-containing protein [Bryobacteraceae bacterium]
MSSPLNTFFKMTGALLEAGLVTMHAGARAMQDNIEALTGTDTKAAMRDVPVNGPTTVDGALAQIGNHVMRIGWRTKPEPAGVMQAMAETLQSARHAFGYIEPFDARFFALPITVPLSAFGLMSELALRAVMGYSVLGPKRLAPFARDIGEMYSEVGVFLSLQYDKLIEFHRERLRQNPNDNETRAVLGRILVKCGLYDQAIEELRHAEGDPSTREVALHETAVAHYRAGRFQQAVDKGIETMRVNPENERARAWLWLSSQSLGGYPDSVPPGFRMEVKAGHEPTTFRVEDIAAKIGMDKTSAGRGTAVIDFNNDGLLDLVFTGAHGGLSLYRNNGDGTFTDVSVNSGLDECVNGFVVTAGDYDNDGFVDLYVTRLGFYVGNSVLYHNNGDGTFTDVTAQAGVENWGPGFTASWVDYDCDGHLDLFVANNLGGLFDRRMPNRLFHNNGDGTFTEVTEQAGMYTIFPTFGSCWGDYNNDGYPDLFVSASLGRPQLFRNNGDGTFTEVGLQAGLTEVLIGSTCFFCDYDNDGWLDIVQFTWSDHEDVIHTLRNGHGPADGRPMRVYHNNRDGTFSVRSEELGIDGCWGTMTGNCGDLNNDGNLEILLGNGSPRMDRLEPLVLLENDGNKFRNVTFSAGLPFVGKSHGTNCADLFGDGRLSVIIAAGGAYPGDLLTASVYCPVERTGNYLNVRLTGTRSNRSAIGARVTIHTGSKLQMREVGGGTNFGCLPLEQHFGLGSLAAIDSLEIRWPSGLVQRFTNPPVNRSITIVEGETTWKDTYPGR